MQCHRNYGVFVYMECAANFRLTASSGLIQSRICPDGRLVCLNKKKTALSIAPWTTINTIINVWNIWIKRIKWCVGQYSWRTKIQSQSKSTARAVPNIRCSRPNSNWLDIFKEILSSFEILTSWWTPFGLFLNFCYK